LCANAVTKLDSAFQAISSVNGLDSTGNAAGHGPVFARFVQKRMPDTPHPARSVWTRRCAADILRIAHCVGRSHRRIE
jgi:hypothetical protein